MSCTLERMPRGGLALSRPVVDFGLIGRQGVWGVVDYSPTSGERTLWVHIVHRPPGAS